jgi:hypothetical protein
MLLLGFDNAANSACLLPDRFELSLQNDSVCSLSASSQFYIG